MKKNPKKTVNSKKKMLLGAIPLLAVLLLSILLIAKHSNNDAGDATVFSVNGEPVSKAEFLNVMAGLRANVFTYFVQKYGAKDSPSFWTTGYQGEVPIEVLKQRTLDKLKRIKTEQIVMKQKGIAGDISYSGFLQNLKDENDRRQKAIASGKPIFGPQRFDEAGYYDVLHGNRIEELKKKMADQELSSTADEIATYYNEKKETEFKKIASINYETVSVSYIDTNGGASSDKKTTAQNVASKIMGDAAKGGKLEDIADFYKKQGETGIEYTVRNLDESNYRSDTMTYPLLMAALNNLQIDQVSRVIDENGSFAIAKVLNKSADSYSSLDEAIEQIKKDLADKKYVEYIDKLVQAAKIVINDNVYKSMS